LGTFFQGNRACRSLLFEHSKKIPVDQWGAFWGDEEIFTNEPIVAELPVVDQVWQIALQLERSPVLERVNKKRIELLSKAYKDLGQNPTQALNISRLLYSVYIGYIHFLKLCPSTITSEADRKAYLKYVFEVLIE